MSWWRIRLALWRLKECLLDCWPPRRRRKEHDYAMMNLLLRVGTSTTIHAINDHALSNWSEGDR